MLSGVYPVPKVFRVTVVRSTKHEPSVMAPVSAVLYHFRGNQAASRRLNFPGQRQLPDVHLDVGCYTLGNFVPGWKRLVCTFPVAQLKAMI